MQRDDRLFFVIGLCITLTIGGIAGILWFASSITGPEPGRPQVEVVPVKRPAPAPDPAMVVPASNPAPVMEGGDELVRRMAAELSTHPRLASWLVTDDLVRRFVSAVESVAGGYSPRDELDFLRPVRPFIVRDDDVAGLVIAAGSFRRYDLAAEVFVSLDTEGVLQLYRDMEPLIEETHRDLTWSDTDFDQRLREAIDHLLEVQVPAGQLMVERRTLTYAFADDEQERLTDAQRQLLRMGPQNARNVQAKLRELRRAFGWPEPTPPELVEAALVTAVEEPAPAAPVQVAELPEPDAPDDAPDFAEPREPDAREDAPGPPEPVVAPARIADLTDPPEGRPGSTQVSVQGPAADSVPDP
jgi:hypothetical protein